MRFNKMSSDQCPSTSAKASMMDHEPAYPLKLALERRLSQLKKNIALKQATIANLSGLEADLEILKMERDYLNLMLTNYDDTVDFSGHAPQVPESGETPNTRNDQNIVQHGGIIAGGINNVGPGCTIIVKIINYPKPLTHIHNDKPDHQTINNSTTNDNPCSSKASVQIRPGNAATLHAPHVNQKVEDSSGDEDSEKDSEDNLSDDD